MREKIRLVCPNASNEDIVMNYLDELIAHNSTFNGCAMLEEYRADYRGWLAKLERFKENPPLGYSKSETFILVDAEETYVIGMIELRYELTEYLFNYGGHIGYSVRPTERRNGYAKKMLALALEKYKEKNINEVLICCNKENIASAKTIMANGGVLDCEAIKDEKVYQKYWIKL